MELSKKAVPGMTAVTRIGHYEVERVLGAGGMGVVYLAVSPSGRQAAVKVIREQFAADPLFRVRFAREVEAARAVSGAFTAPVVDADTGGDMPWMATLYVPGPTLAEHVAAGGPMAADEVWRLASGLVEALRDIHRAGLVHRDLKPGNILLADDGPRVIDFGISRAADSDALTRTGVVIGTPPFMAPEQFRTPKETGRAADVFALGSVLAYAATGRSPFEAESGYAIAWNVVHEPPVLEGLPPSLLAVVGPCLAKDPADRPTADELLALLGSRAHRRKSGRAVPPPVRTTLPRRRVRAAVGAGVLLTLAVTAWALYADGLRKAPPAADSPSSPASASAPSGPAREAVAKPAPAGWARWETPIPSGDRPLHQRRNSGLRHCLGTGKDVLCEGEAGVLRFDGATGNVRSLAAGGSGDDHELLAVTPATGLAYLMRRDTPTGNEERPSGTLLAVDTSTGKFRWQRRLTDATFSGASVMGDTLFTATGDTGSGLRARHARSGDTLWTRQFTAYDTLRVVPESDALLVEGYAGGSSESVLLRLSPSDGKTRWQRPTNGRFVVIGGTRDTLIALDSPTSTQPSEVAAVVQLSVSNGKDLPGRAALKVSPRAVATATAVIDLREDGRLRAVDLISGKELWAEATGADPVQGPVLHDGRVYVQTTNGEIVARDAGTGREIWRSARRRDPQKAVACDPGFWNTLIVQDCTVYSTSSRGTVFALAPPR